MEKKIKFFLVREYFSYVNRKSLFELQHQTFGFRLIGIFRLYVISIFGLPSTFRECIILLMRKEINDINCGGMDLEYSATSLWTNFNLNFSHPFIYIIVDL